MAILTQLPEHIPGTAQTSHHPYCSQCNEPLMTLSESSCCKRLFNTGLLDLTSLHPGFLLGTRPMVYECMYCIQTAKDIVKLLSQPGSPIILVFWPRVPIPNSKGNPFNGAQNTQGGKNLWFLT